MKTAQWCVAAAGMVLSGYVGGHHEQEPFPPHKPTTHRVYVTNIGDGTISVIDTTANAVIATINVGGRPAAIRVDAQAHRAYFTDLNSGNIHVIDTTSNSELSPIPVGTTPLAGLAIDTHAKRLYAAEFSDAPGQLGNVSTVNAINHRVTTFAAGTKLQDFAVNSTSGRAYVTDFGDGAFGNGTVKVIENRTVLASIPSGTESHGVAVDASSRRLYVTNLGDDTVSVFDTATNTIVTTIAVGRKPQAVAVYPAINRAYVTSETENTVTVIDTSSNTVETTVGVGDSPQGLDVDAAHGMIYVANSNSGTVSVISASTNTVTTTIAVGANPVRVAVAQ